MLVKWLQLTDLALPSYDSRISIACSLHPVLRLRAEALLTCRRVQGLDATAARTFATLHNALKRTGVELILTHMPPARSAALKWLRILAQP